MCDRGAGQNRNLSKGEPRYSWVKERENRHVRKNFAVRTVISGLGHQISSEKREKRKHTREVKGDGGKVSTAQVTSLEAERVRRTFRRGKTVGR